MSAHLPIRIARPLYRQCVFQSPIAASARPFSTTIARQKRGDTGMIDPVKTLEMIKDQLRGGQSGSAMYERESGKSSNLPDDIGLLPGTFIRAPFGTLMKQLSWTEPKSVKTVLWYYYKCAESKFKAWILLWRFRNISTRCPPLHFMERKSIRALAAEKYRFIYQSFARGNSKDISKICASTTAQKFSQRIAARPRDMTMQWTCDKSPKTYVVSNRALLLSLPGYENTGIQQIVVRVKSRWQVLDIKHEATGGTRNEGKNIVEYIVLQRMVFSGEFKDWTVWGFTEEWSPETIEEDAERERQLNRYNADTA